MAKELSHKSVCAKGGRSKSPRKLKAILKNLKKAREAKNLNK